jgi:tetratricopeptide (TPR) repeat protein
MALFPLTEVDPLFWLCGGIVTARLAGPARAGSTGSAPRGGRRVVRSVLWPAVAALAIIVLVAGAVETMWDEVPWSFRGRFIEAERAGAVGDIAAAIDANRAGLALAPADPALLIQEASLRDGQEALELWRTLSINDPHHPVVQLRRGGAELAAGNPVLALRAWERAARLDDDSTDALILSAALHIELGQLGQARQRLLEASRRQPDDPNISRLTSQIASIEDSGTK